MYELANYTHSIFLLIHTNIIMFKIKKQLLQEICNSAKNNFPKEMLIFLSKNNEIIDQIVYLPNIAGETFVEINSLIIPFDNKIVGTIHSHPLGENHPSKEDKKFFQNYSINGIIDNSFKLENIKFYNEKGGEIKIVLIE